MGLKRLGNHPTSKFIVCRTLRQGEQRNLQNGANDFAAPASSAVATTIGRTAMQFRLKIAVSIRSDAVAVIILLIELFS